MSNLFCNRLSSILNNYLYRCARVCAMDVVVRIKDPVLRCFLAAILERREEGYLANISTLTGAAVCCSVREHGKPELPDPSDAAVVRFYLPRSRIFDRFRGRFLSVGPDGERFINSMLRKEFDLHFFTFCTERRLQGLKIKDIIPLFIFENRLDVFDGDIETLKKRYYRKELQQFERLHDTLRQKAYFHLGKFRQGR